MNNQTPLVSVIIPCYNAEEFIAETIESVLNQSFTDFELIIIDDGSTDQSSTIINRYTDPRIRYHKISNLGVAKARNIGIDLAKGELISFLDADDLFLISNLEKKVKFLKDNPEYNIVHSSAIIFESESGQNLSVSEGLGGRVLNALFEFSQSVVNSPSSIIIERKLIKDVGGFDSNLSTSADWELWVRIAHKKEFGYLAEPLIKYRLHGNQMHKNIPLMDKEMKYAFEKSYNSGFFKSKRYFRSCYSRVLVILGLSYLKYSNKKIKGLNQIFKGLIYNPVTGFKHLIKR